MLHSSTILATAGLALTGHHVLLVILELTFGLVVHPAHLTQFIKLGHSLLTHHCLC